MTTLNLQDAKTQLPQLIDLICAGEEVIISRRDQPAVRLMAIELPKSRRKSPTPRHKIHIDPACFEALPDDEGEQH
ncbi:MAG: type II toxin-antitoxin system Phd/YefM family antitoxin [Candidatus Competibacterales bacterium]